MQQLGSGLPGTGARPGRAAPAVYRGSESGSGFTGRVGRPQAGPGRHGKSPARDQPWRNLYRR